MCSYSFSCISMSCSCVWSGSLVHLSVDEEHQLWSSLISGSSFCQGETSSGPRTSAGILHRAPGRLPLGSKKVQGRGWGREQNAGQHPVCRCDTLGVGESDERPSQLSLPPPTTRWSPPRLWVLTVQFTSPAPAPFPWILPLDETLLFRPCLPQFLCQPLPPKAAHSCPPKLAPHQLLLPDCCPSFSPTPPATSKTHSLPPSPVFP